ncbi:SLC13/DASS family transporter [Streptomyces bathyalis]|uniref:Sodium-dependent dicarboxylate transporter SdcS n=1 Tax=Streptomyces bathyalis TaxID=2710756 RepID=A0A7T1WRU6_9ACTN|nr:DASS family sodium-coupled anion symporter [Streptomyces bathyalis]QPP06836.1 SLC13/DASS family transporter [Streptomyces bathyalis]
METTTATKPETERAQDRQERFDHARHRVGLLLGPLAFAAVLLFGGGLPTAQRTLTAIFALVMIWWISEAIPLAVTALLAIALCVLLGVGDEDAVFGALGSDTIFTFLGGFVIARAMTVHGLDRRIALRLLAVRGVVRSPARMVIAFGCLAAAISAFVSNTATVAMLFPIALGMISSVSSISAADSGHDLRRSRISIALLLMVAYGASIGGLFTPVGAPHQLIGRQLIEEQTGENIDFLHWVGLFAPIVLVMFVVLCVVLLLLNRPEVKRLEGAEEYVAAERAKLHTFSPGERNTCIAFAVAVLLWVSPSVLQAVLGEEHPFAELIATHVTEGVAAILAATLLFLLPLPGPGNKATLEWSDAAKIDWGTILLFGAGIVLGTLSADTGLAKTLGGALSDLIGVSSLTSVTILAAVTGVLISESTSNTASVGIVLPIVLPMAQALHVDPLIPGLVATAATGYGFMLPVSTPPNAIVYGSGLIPITRMVRTGVVFDVLGMTVLVTGVLTIGPLLGL